MSEGLTQDVKRDAGPVPDEVVIIVRGGVVQDVYSSARRREIIWLVDWDNIMDSSGRETHAELIDPADISELDTDARIQIEAEIAQWKRDRFTEGRTSPDAARSSYLSH